MDRTSFILLICINILITGCRDIKDDAGNSSNQTLSLDVEPVSGGAWYQPNVGTSWHWQLQVSNSQQLAKNYVVDIYDIDLFDTPAAEIEQLQLNGHRVVCYFSAGSYENWRADASAFKLSDFGRNLDGWVGENWLDIRSANVHRIMLKRLDLAVAKGCDGVEPDNVDGYINDTGFNLTADEQLAFNRFLANEAHMRDLSIGLKNDLDQIPLLVDYFDFAVNEQCFEYNECELLLPFIDANKAVLSAEYGSIYKTDKVERDALCSRANSLQLSTLILSESLDDSYLDSCL